MHHKAMIESKLTNMKAKIANNAKVVENYFFMTALQIISSLFGVLIYPYLIRTLGAASYGLYVFALSVTSYFTGFISFGFSFPALKAIVENRDNAEVKSRIVSSVFTAKCYLAILSAVVFLPFILFIPVMHNSWLIFSICFSQVIGEILFPIWYFQGVQKMKIVTYIQLGFRIFSLPFIFIFIKSATDCWIYVLIASLTVILGGLVSVYYLKKQESITLKIVSFHSLKNWFRDAMPFFWSSATATIKQESVTVIIGAFFGMREVAFYDLANKIILVPRMLTTSINSALFPKIMERTEKNVIRKIIRYETLIGMAVIAGVVLFGYWAVLLLGGQPMLEAYPLAIILSGSLLVWLIVGSYINFIFVPQNKYYFVTRNQFVAFFSFIIFCILGVVLFHNIAAVVVAITLSGFCEIIYCYSLIKKHKLL